MAILLIFVRQKGDNERNRAVLAKELQAGGYPRVVVRSDGEPALLAHVRSARAMTMVSDVPLGSVHEQVSREQSPGNGLASRRAGNRAPGNGENSYTEAQHRDGSWEANPGDS